MYLATKTRRARSPWFQSIKRVIGFSLKLSDCYAKFGAAKLSLFSFHTLGGYFFVSLSISLLLLLLLLLIFNLYFILLVSAVSVPLPPAERQRREAIRSAGGSGMCSRARGDPRPGPAAPTPPSADRPARGNRSRGPQRRTAKKIYKQNNPPRAQRKNKKPPWKGNLKKRRK